MNWIREHVIEELPGGQKRCLHCHAINPDPENNTCIARPENLRPEPALRRMAADDFDFIGERLRELQAERAEPPLEAWVWNPQRLLPAEPLE